MTQDELLKSLERHAGLAILTAREFHETFPGRMLDAVEEQFKIELLKAGGPPFNPHGSSQSDRVLTFCKEHGLSFQWVKGGVFFLRGQMPVPMQDSLLAIIESSLAAKAKPN